MRIPTTGAIIAGMIGLLLVIGPVSAQQPPLPTFVDGQVLTATQLNALVDQINSLQTALAAAQNNIATLQTTLGTKANQSNLSDVQTTLSSVQTTLSTKANQSDLTGLRTDLTTAQSNVTGLRTDLTTTQGNISTLQSGLSTAQGDIRTLQTGLGTAQTTLTTAQPVLALAPYVQVSTTTLQGLTGPHILFTGANVHIRSGSGSTDDGTTLTGLGNLIVGYNEMSFTDPFNPQLIFTAGSRTGSHNLVVGPAHTYTSFGGLVAGEGNVVSGALGSVSGGRGNTTSNLAASVSGGTGNTASGTAASVSGGSNVTLSASDTWAAGTLVSPSF